MTPERLDECLALIGWSRMELAKRLAVSSSLVQQWSKGGSRMAPEDAAWIEVLAAFHASHPPPPRQERRQGAQDASRLERLKALVAAGSTLAGAAAAMGENPKTLRNFAARHRVSPRAAAPAEDQTPTAPSRL